jgi:S-adenosylmethionine:tRNA ribosyltransferase-isomerase
MGRALHVAAAADPRRAWQKTRLLTVNRQARSIVDLPVARLEHVLGAGDLLVLNDAATLPASLSGELVQASGARAEVELRLATTSAMSSFPAEWTVVLFGGGDWRMDTDRRPAPPRARPGDRIELGDRERGLSATVQRVHAVSPRLLTVRFDRQGDGLGRAIYENGRPVQYAHVSRPVALGEVQTPYAARPWAIEMPSTGRPLRWPLLDRLVARGVELAWLTEAAGLSATGDPRLDAALPLPERYEVPSATAEAIVRTRRRGGRIVAVGTTVVRALEASGGAAGAGIATTRLARGSDIAIVDALITGVHSPGESHWDLLRAFADDELLQRAHREAARLGYLAHEHGDLMLLA